MANNRRTKARRKKPARTKQDVLTILLQLITVAFPTDRLTPGVVTSHVPVDHPTNGNTVRPFEYRDKPWYASIARFPATGGRIIEMTAYGDSVQEVHRNLATQMMKRVTLGDQLRRALRG